MGLLEFLNSPDAQLGVGLLAAGGPTTDPNRAGLGQRIAGAMQGVDAQKDAELKRAFVKSQMDENTQQIAARNLQAQRDAQIQALVMSRMQGGGQPQGMGAPAVQSMQGGTSSFPVAANGSAASGGAWQPNDVNAPSAPMGANGQPLPMQGRAPSFPFSLNDVTGLTALGYKNAPALFEQLKYASDGVKLEGGNTYRDPTTGVERYIPKLDTGMGMVNGQVAPLAGYSAANAQIKGQEAGAVAGAKMPFDIQTDRARQVTGAQLQTKTVVGPDGNQYEVPLYSLAQGQGGMPGAGGQGGLSTGAPSAFPGAYQSGRNPITQQSAIAINDNFLKSAYQPTIDAGKTATDLQNSIQAVRNMDVSTGWGTDQKAQAAAFLEGLGLASGSATMFAANAQKFQSVAMDRLQTSLIAQKGTQTEGDAQRAGQIFAALKNTPEANQFILDFAQAKANADQKKAAFYEQALPLAQKAGDLTAVDRAWRKVGYSVWSDPILQPWSKK